MRRLEEEKEVLLTREMSRRAWLGIGRTPRGWKTRSASLNEGQAASMAVAQDHQTTAVDRGVRVRFDHQIRNVLRN